MTYTISDISHCRGKTGNLMIRFNVTIADTLEPDDSETFYGCLAGNNAYGLYAWPPKNPTSRFQPVKWSKTRENNVLQALQEVGELKRIGD